MRGSDSLTVKCWQMSLSSPSMLCLMLGEANSLSSCFSLFPARQRKDSTRGLAGASQVLGELLGWSSPALLLGRHSCMYESSWHCQTLCCVLGRWGLVGSWSFGFTPSAGTAGSVGLCVRAMAGEGGCGGKVPVHPRGWVRGAPSFPSGPRTISTPGGAGVSFLSNSLQSAV